MNQDLNKLFGELLRELRNESSISQENLALDSELDRSFISLLERGLRTPTITTLFKISKSLNKYPSEIIKLLEKKYENS